MNSKSHAEMFRAIGVNQGISRLRNEDLKRRYIGEYLLGFLLARKKIIATCTWLFVKNGAL